MSACWPTEFCTADAAGRPSCWLLPVPEGGPGAISLGIPGLTHTQTCRSGVIRSAHDIWLPCNGDQGQAASDYSACKYYPNESHTQTGSCSTRASTPPSHMRACAAGEDSI
eukprot:1157065-Pelagomonas_calceolata.AAC.4